MKRCVVCAQLFQPRHSRQRCCFGCPGSAIIGGKFHIQKRCQVCAQLFHTTVFGQRTCSQGCGVQLGNTRRELTSDVVELAERIDDAWVATTPVSMTALRRRLSPEEAARATRCPVCAGRILREPDEYDVVTLSCLQCGRVFGQLRPATSSTKLGWAKVIAPDKR